MSKLVSIVEGQSSKQFNNVGFLRTSLQGGGYCDWIPEDERVLKSKSVTKNGTYKAINDSAYAYDEFTVNVPKKDAVTGKKPNGNEATVSRDDDGYLKETGVPSSIRITTNPSKMTYSDGETIDMSGAVIKAYNADGSLWGNVPLNEVELDPTTATKSGDSNLWTSGDGINAKLINYVPVSATYPDGSVSNSYAAISATGTRRLEIYDNDGHVIGYDNFPVALGGDGVATLFATIYNDELYLMRLGGDNNCNLFVYNNGQKTTYGTFTGWRIGGGTNYRTTYNEWTKAVWHEYFVNVFPKSTREPSGGASDMHEVAETQSITVKWNRPGDGEELTTSFNITVS